MSDFTKEELIDLNVIVKLWNVQFMDDNQTKILGDKIQSMIDNYCDHEIRSKYGDCIDCGHNNGVCCE